MKYRVSRLAAEDLVEIYSDGLSKHGERLADDYQLSLSKAFDYLAENPGIGTSCPEILPQARKLVVQSHVIFYEETGEVTCTIEIVRVLHGRMDLYSQF